MKIHLELKNFQDLSYDIFIQDLPSLNFEKKVAVITNIRVSKLYKDLICSKIKAKELLFVEIPDGEQHKTQESVDFILAKLFEAKFDRNSLLIAFGGGVIGDITGFCAGIYKRGIDFLSIPTTLLAMVDASVGGKTGINSVYGKNLIGLFYQPKAVFMDISFLKTLPKREFNAGMAELIKISVMLDSELFRSLFGKNNLQDLISKAILLKAKIVQEDEKEANKRMILNYGHTFGHIVENQTNYSTYLHGEAVSIGMVMANELAFLMGLISQKEKDDILFLLKKYALPTSYKIGNVQKFYNAFFLDKKASGERILFVLPNGIGAGKILEAKKEKILKVLEKFAK